MIDKTSIKRMDNKHLLSTNEVTSFLKITRATLQRHEGKGNIKHHVIYAGKKYFTISDVRKLAGRLRKWFPGTPMVLPGEEGAETEVSTDIGMVAEALGEDLSGNFTTKEGQDFLRNRLIEFANKEKVLSVLFADLHSHDWRARHSSIKIILNKILPDLSSAEIINTPDEQTKERHERVAIALEKAAADLLQTKGNGAIPTIAASFLNIEESDDKEIIDVGL